MLLERPSAPVLITGRPYQPRAAPGGFELCRAKGAVSAILMVVDAANSVWSW